MRPFLIIRFGLLAISSLFLFSCNKKEEYVTATVKDYIPLTPGKYITYRLDSMVFTNFGRTTEVHRYQVKHIVDALITDNLGRPSYRVYRYLRDSLGIQPWQAAGSYMITPLTNQVELIEDNLRFIKIHLPITDAFTWNGNKYLPADPYGPLYSFNNDDNMEDWDFYFNGEASSFSYRGNNYSNVITVEEDDETFGIPITPSTLYASRSRAVERYSKNIGLIYREYELWEYQTNSPPPFKTGFGITMWMIDHN